VYVAPLRMSGAAGRVVCPSCAVADRPLARLRGLLGRRGLGAGEGLLLKPAPSIHTCFMRFAIDAVFLDDQMQVLDVRPDLRPWRFAGVRRSRAVLELAGGEARRLGIAPGTVLELDEPAGGRAGHGA
jgi:uncharacterized protein